MNGVTLVLEALSNSSRLPANTSTMLVSPVMFPPGRAKLATNLIPTRIDNMGYGEVASLAGVGVGPPVMMTFTLRRTSSAASGGRLSSFTKT